MKINRRKSKKHNEKHKDSDSGDEIIYEKKTKKKTTLDRDTKAFTPSRRVKTFENDTKSPKRHIEKDEDNDFKDSVYHSDKRHKKIHKHHKYKNSKYEYSDDEENKDNKKEKYSKFSKEKTKIENNEKEYKVIYTLIIVFIGSL